MRARSRQDGFATARLCSRYSYHSGTGSQIPLGAALIHLHTYHVYFTEVLYTPARAYRLLYGRADHDTPKSASYLPQIKLRAERQYFRVDLLYTLLRGVLRAHGSRRLSKINGVQLTRPRKDAAILRNDAAHPRGTAVMMLRAQLDVVRVHLYQIVRHLLVCLLRPWSAGALCSRHISTPQVHAKMPSTISTTKKSGGTTHTPRPPLESHSSTAVEPTPPDSPACI